MNPLYMDNYEAQDMWWLVHFSKKLVLGVFFAISTLLTVVVLMDKFCFLDDEETTPGVESIAHMHVS